MSALFSRLVQQHAAGHARADVVAHHDARADLSARFTPAAVLIAVTERERPGILLIHRPSTMRAHPGQVALPGGKLDPGESPVEAALREANEELGIVPEAVRIVGEGDIYRTGTGFEITPVIGVVPPDIHVDPNPAEVAQWFEAPLDFLLDPANQHEFSIEWQDRLINYWEIMWQEHRIWGVTAGVIVNLARRLHWHD